MLTTFSFIRMTGWMCSGILSIGLLSVNQYSLANTEKPTPPSLSKAALSVTTTKVLASHISTPLHANGNVMAWQEAVIGAEGQGLRLQEVRVNIGDSVRKGQVLATFDSELIVAELAQSKAAVTEAQAMLMEAAANAQRARDMQPSGVISVQQANQWLTAERAAQARLDATKALLKIQELRLDKTQIKAPDHGIITNRQATVGAVVPPGMELFRMIRQGRLEWRGEVAATELPLVQTGRKVNVSVVGLSKPLEGIIRQVAPSLDPTTRNALVYVDLPPTAGLKAGMFARGEFETTTTSALTIPQTALLLRDGFSYVFSIGKDNKVRQLKVQVGRRSGTQIEITQGLDQNTLIVETGVGFLADGDTVRIVSNQTKP